MVCSRGSVDALLACTENKDKDSMNSTDSKEKDSESTRKTTFDLKASTRTPESTPLPDVPFESQIDCQPADFQPSVVFVQAFNEIFVQFSETATVFFVVCSLCLTSRSYNYMKFSRI